MHIAHLARAENEPLASVLEDELRFILREEMRGAIVLLRQLLLPLHPFAGEANDHVVLIGFSVNRDSAECGALDLHGLTLVPNLSTRLCLRLGRRAPLRCHRCRPGRACFPSIAGSRTAPRQSQIPPAAALWCQLDPQAHSASSLKALPNRCGWRHRYGGRRPKHPDPRCYGPMGSSVIRRRESPACSPRPGFWRVGRRPTAARSHAALCTIA